mmetsp:Transcript_25791/g.61098  ORF Transcript_25791/g.61098 Transcript_25791/m.61098 type:complete len:658 (+) Transcript_25791:252-2225(+)
MSQVPPSAVLAALQAEQIRVAQQRASIIQQQARASLVGNNNAAAAAAAAAALQEQQQQQQQQAAARASFMLNPAANNQNLFLQQLQQQQQMMATLAQLNAASSMVATAKLANVKSKGNKDSNSTVVVRSSVPKLTNSGSLYTVAQWTRKCVEDNLEFLVKVCRRSDPKATAVMLTYGDYGETQTLVLFDGHINKSPTDLKKVPIIGVGVASSYADDKRDEAKMAAGGVIQPTDSMWEHLRYEQAASENSNDVNEGSSAKKAKAKGPKIMFLLTQPGTGQFNGTGGSRRVLQIKTGASNGKPYVATSFSPDPVFEQQVLELWAAQTGGSARPAMPLVPMAAAAAAGGLAVGATAAAGGQKKAEEDDYDTLIEFNPRELMILERAFDGRLRKQDLKQSVKKFNDKDKEDCQEVIARANAEFKYVMVRGPKKKTATKKKATAESKKRKSPPPEPQPADEKDKASKPSPAKKKKAEPKAKPSETKKGTSAKAPAKTKKEAAASSKKTTPAPKSAKKEKKEPAKSKKEVAASSKKSTPAAKSTKKKDEVKKGSPAKKTASPSKTIGGKSKKAGTPAKGAKKSSSPVKKKAANAKTPTTKASQTKTGTPASSPKAKSATKAKSAVKAKQTPKKAASPGTRRGLRSVAPPANKTRSRSRSKSRK